MSNDSLSQKLVEASGFCFDIMVQVFSKLFSLLLSPEYKEEDIYQSAHINFVLIIFC